MKLFTRCSAIVLLSLFSLNSQAKTHNEIIIINHFDKPIHYKITINPEVLPNFPKEFTLAVNDQAASTVLDIKKEAYILTEDLTGKSGFWGVDIEKDQTHIHGYRSKGIAYSWKAQTIVFCTPEEYEQNGSCISVRL